MYTHLQTEVAERRARAEVGCGDGARIDEARQRGNALRAPGGNERGRVVGRIGDHDLSRLVRHVLNLQLVKPNGLEREAGKVHAQEQVVPPAPRFLETEVVFVCVRVR